MLPSHESYMDVNRKKGITTIPRRRDQASRRYKITFEQIKRGEHFVVTTSQRCCIQSLQLAYQVAYVFNGEIIRKRHFDMCFRFLFAIEFMNQHPTRYHNGYYLNIVVFPPDPHYRPLK